MIQSLLSGDPGFGWELSSTRHKQSTEDGAPDSAPPWVSGRLPEWIITDCFSEAEQKASCLGREVGDP